MAIERMFTEMCWLLERQIELKDSVIKHEVQFHIILSHLRVVSEAAQRIAPYVREFDIDEAKFPLVARCLVAAGHRDEPYGVITDIDWMGEG